VREALLALLSKEPSHGYELHQRLSAVFGDAQAELNPGQVYVAPSRLERGGLVAVRDVPQGSRPDKKVYEVTEAGREMVVRWLAEQRADEAVHGGGLADLAPGGGEAHEHDLGVVGSVPVTPTGLHPAESTLDAPASWSRPPARCRPAVGRPQPDVPPAGLRLRAGGCPVYKPLTHALGPLRRLLLAWAVHIGGWVGAEGVSRDAGDLAAG